MHIVSVSAAGRSPFDEEMPGIFALLPLGAWRLCKDPALRSLLKGLEDPRITRGQPYWLDNVIASIHVVRTLVAGRKNEWELRFLDDVVRFWLVKYDSNKGYRPDRHLRDYRFSSGLWTDQREGEAPPDGILGILEELSALMRHSNEPVD